MEKKRSNQIDTKRLKAIGHKLHPLVTVGDKGLTNNVMSEILRALSDHELIKITVKHPDRDEKRQMMQSICDSSGATLVQTVGHVALIYKANPEPNPRLSNILRNL